MTYQQLDTIADSINPTLALLTLILPFLVRRVPPQGRPQFFLGTGLSMAAMYALGWVDNVLHLWPSLGLDYSGHTGFAAVLVISISFWNRRLGIAGFSVLLAYVLLMLYQKYHTVADVISTLGVIAPLTFGIHSAIGHAGRRLQITNVQSH